MGPDEGSETLSAMRPVYNVGRAHKLSVDSALAIKMTWISDDWNEPSYLEKSLVKEKCG